MNVKHGLFITLFSFAAGGLAVFYWPSPPPQAQSTTTANSPLYWVAPMDPSFRRDEPGKSPMGMDLTPVYAEQAADDAPGTVIISPAVENNLGVKIGHVKRESIYLPINTVGFIQFNQQSVNHIHSRVNGWIENLTITAIGDTVNKGQQLFTLYSPQLVNAQEELVAELRIKNRGLVKGAVRKLKALGVDDRVIKSLQQSLVVKQQVPFFAPATGYIATLNVREGSFIEPAKEVLSIGGLEQVWVIAEVFERQAALLKPGLRVRMSIETYPGDEWQGVVEHVHPVLDPKTRTLRARIVFDNKDHRLKPNMFARLHIQAGVKDDVLTVAREAIIYQSGVSRVVKALGNGRFRSVAIRAGIESGDRVEVIEGLSDEDQVVISSQFMIDSESNLNAEFARMENEDDHKASNPGSHSVEAH